MFVDADGIARCRQRLEADPRHYTHADALADLDEIRQRLGTAGSISGAGSWGTRAALLYTMTYPHAVRSVVLDGAVSLSMEFPRTVATHAQRALDALLSACAADAACAATHADAREQLATLLARLDAGPMRVAVRHPRTGVPTTLTLDRDVVVEILRVMLYTPSDAARLLQVVRHAVNGDVGPLAAQFLRSASASIDDMALGQTLSVLCSEDLPLVDGADFSGDAAGTTFTRASYADAWRSRCRAWPRGPAIAHDRRVTTPVPALILSGDARPGDAAGCGRGDGRRTSPVTCTSSCRARRTTRRSADACPDLIAEFIARGSPSPMDTGCAEQCRVAAGRSSATPGAGHDRAAQPGKTYGKTVAVNSVSFTAPDGCVTGLLGPNGAGKTTTIRAITGLIRPDGGAAVVDGDDVQRDPTLARSRMGVLPEVAGLYDHLTVREHLATPEHCTASAGRICPSRRRAARSVRVDTACGSSRRHAVAGATPPRGAGSALVHDPAQCRARRADQRPRCAERAGSPPRNAPPGRRGPRGDPLQSRHARGRRRLRPHRHPVARRVVASGTPAAILAQTRCESLEDAFVSVIGSEEGLN